MEEDEDDQETVSQLLLTMLHSMKTLQFQAESSSTPQLPKSAKLVDNSIPTLVTEVPAIEVPTKFEDLLEDPRIVFKSVSGNENRVNAKVIRRLKDKKTAMDRAREMLRNRLNGVSTTETPLTSTQEPFITVVPPKRGNNRPRPFSKLQSSTSTTTISSLIQASTTVPPPSPPGTTLSVRDKMVAARNRLRALMGQNPIGITPTTPRSTPTTPTPSTPTKMDITRQKIIEDLRLREELEEALNSTELDLTNANLALPPDPQITVTAKSTIGDQEVNPLILISPTFPPEADSTTTTTSRPNTTPLTLVDNVLDVPARMQDTLLRLMQKKGLRRDPFAKLVTTAVTLIDPDEDIEDFTPPSVKQNPLATKTLRPNFDDSRDVELETPRTRQSNLLGQLQADNDGVFEGLSTPRPHQDTLLKQLQANNDGVFEGISTPNSHQSELLNALKGGDEGLFEGLSTPNPRQSNLLKQLKANQNGIYEGLSTPSTRQDYLLRQLQRGRNENLRLETPSPKQNPLLRQLKKGHDERITGISTPSSKQNPLLRNLQGGHTRENDELDLPINPVDEPLFRPARPLDRFNPDGLNLPRRRQNPLLRILRFDKRERILSKGLTPPRHRQNPLFRQLVATPQKYRSDFLQLPPKQQNKLLAILRRHGGDNFDADELLTVPQFKEELDVIEMPLLEDEEDDYYDDEEEYDDYEEVQEFTPSTTTLRSRPKMPPSKFEVLQIRRPVEEVTFQRVNEPLTLKDKKEGSISTLNDGGHLEYFVHAREKETLIPISFQL